MSRVPTDCNLRKIGELIQFLPVYFEDVTKTDYIRLTNRVRGPYYKLRTEGFFPLSYRPSANREGHKSTGKNEDPYLR